MNLNQLLETTPDALFTDFMIVGKTLSCFWCGTVATSIQMYQDRNVSVEWLESFPVDKEKFESIRVAQAHKIHDNFFVIATTHSMSSYHCPSCANSPVDISPTDMETYKSYIVEASRLVKRDLDVEFKVKLYNKIASEGGFFNEGKDANAIFINVGYWVNYQDVKKELFKAVAHEARHLWQHRNGWEFDTSVSYLDRLHEIDAREYQMVFASKYLAM
jgi:hypothetical protein